VSSGQVLLQGNEQVQVGDVTMLTSLHGIQQDVVVRFE
jgi:hypothetical protein